MQPAFLRKFIGFAGSVTLAAALSAGSLTREQTIVLPGVTGRIDHLAIDEAGQRLFVAALGHNSVEEISLAQGKVVRSITGLAEPQGLCFLNEPNRLYVANGGDGSLRVYDGRTLSLKTMVLLDDDADNLRYDRAARRLYAGHSSGALSAIDVATDRVVAKIVLPAHPESFQLEQHGSRVFVNVPGARQIVVVDRCQAVVETTWSTGSSAANFPMALDEAHHRLFVGCRIPAQLLVFDTDSGRTVATLELHRDCDDLCLDSAHGQLYASCGEGFIDVFEPGEADRYTRKESLPTEPGARTCFFDGAHLYLAVPKRGEMPAEIRCYRVGP